jgi:hypothetical protein
MRPFFTLTVLERNLRQLQVRRTVEFSYTATRFVDIVSARRELGNVPIVVASMARLPAASEAFVPISDLRRQNVLLTAVAGGSNIVGAGFAHSVERHTSAD